MKYGLLFICLLFSQCASMQEKICHRDFAYKEGMKLGLRGSDLNSDFRQYCEEAPKFATESYDKYLNDGYKDGIDFFCDSKQISKLAKKHVFTYGQSQASSIRKICDKQTATVYQKSYNENRNNICQHKYWVSLGKKDALSGEGAGARVNALTLCPIDQRDNFSRAYTKSYDKQKNVMEKTSW